MIEIGKHALVKPHWIPWEVFSKPIEEINPRLTRILKGKTAESINESDIGKFLAALLKPTDDFPIWVETEVNLWQLTDLPKKKPKSILDEYLHPLQPDIDLLYGPIINGIRSTPMVGVELKIFPKAKGAGAIPKTRGLYGSGYYTGLDQAIALLTFGLDYVYLWHFIVLPLEIWESYAKKHGENFGEKLISEHAEFSKAYAGIMKGILTGMSLPIGYAAHGICLDEGFLWMYPCGEEPIEARRVLLAKPNPLKDNATPRRIRELLCSKLGIKELGTF